MVGIGAVDGVAVEPIYCFEDETPFVAIREVVDTAEECNRLTHAFTVVQSQLEAIMEKVKDVYGDDKTDIFDYQLLMLQDTDFVEKIEDEIKQGAVCESAVEKVCGAYIQLFTEIDNEYLRQRTGDIADIQKRILFALSGKTLKSLLDIGDPVILSANDLLPSQMAEVNNKFVKGILLEKGGKSSHTVILARSMGIPCIVGIENLSAIKDATVVIMDGKTGEIIETPTEEQLHTYRKRIAEQAEQKKLLDPYKTCKAITEDGIEMNVYANITSKEEVAALLENGGDGVGLLRTEFIYMQASSSPSEQAQFDIYAAIAKSLQQRPLIIRTLDAGGDKHIEYLHIPEEENPFLGYRAIRYCLDHADVFKAQMKAILRAGCAGNVHMMFPMITSMQELKRAKALVAEAKDELKGENVPYADVAIGMMMETPAAAFAAERFAAEVDFFSIGTNDLTQYLFAADRNNKNVAHLNNYFHPTLLSAVYAICKAAAAHHIEVDICGQAGEVELLVPMWVAMGVTNLSVSIPSIPKIKKIICETNVQEASQKLQEVLTFDNAEEVINFLNQ